MTDTPDVVTIHLAVLPELRTRTGRIAPAIARSIMTAIVVDTDNGRHQITRERLGEIVGLRSGNAYIYNVLSALVVAGLVRVGPPRGSGIGCPTTRALSVDVEALRRLARRPACHDAPITDPAGVATRPAARELFDLRDKVLNALGVGLAFVGKPLAGRGRCDADRMRTRAAALRMIRERWQARTGVRLCDQHIGYLFGLDAASVVHTLKRYPAAVPAGKIAS